MINHVEYQGQTIQDNVHTIRSIIHYYNHNRQPVGIIQ